MLTSRCSCAARRLLEFCGGLPPRPIRMPEMTLPGRPRPRHALKSFLIFHLAIAANFTAFIQRTYQTFAQHEGVAKSALLGDNSLLTTNDTHLRILTGKQPLCTAEQQQRSRSCPQLLFQTAQQQLRADDGPRYGLSTDVNAEAMLTLLVPQLSERLCWHCLYCSFLCGTCALQCTAAVHCSSAAPVHCSALQQCMHGRRRPRQLAQAFIEACYAGTNRSCEEAVWHVNRLAHEVCLATQCSALMCA